MIGPHRLALGVLALAAGTRPEPIKVGLVGSLSGRHFDLGVSIRDGATLAVEQVNAAGGVNGRQIELLVRDARQVVDGIVRQHFGHVSVDSTPGEGTTFTILLERAATLHDDAPPPTAHGGRNGRETAAALGALRPQMPVLLASGYAADVLADRGQLLHGAELIMKPVAPAELLGKIRELLDRAERARRPHAPVT